MAEKGVEEQVLAMERLLFYILFLVKQKPQSPYKQRILRLS